MNDELEVNQQIKDNDPRMGRRILTVSRLTATYVFARSRGGHGVRILRNRVFTDAKQRRTGFSVVR